MIARKAPNCTSRPTAIARGSACQCELTLCRPVCRVFEPQPSPVPPSTATTPASDCVTCSRDESSRDIATFGVSSCLDMPILDRDMRAGWGTKAHAEATKDARTRNSAPDNVASVREGAAGPSWRGIRACASVRARGVRVAGVAMEIAGRGSVDAHSTLRRCRRVSRGRGGSGKVQEGRRGCS